MSFEVPQRCTGGSEVAQNESEFHMVRAVGLLFDGESALQ